MTNPVTTVVNALFVDKWFQMLLTLVVIVGYIILSAMAINNAAEVFQGFSFISFGYWFGQMGSGVSIAKQATSDAQKVS